MRKLYLSARWVGRDDFRCILSFEPKNGKWFNVVSDIPDDLNGLFCILSDRWVSRDHKRDATCGMGLMEEVVEELLRQPLERGVTENDFHLLCYVHEKGKILIPVVETPGEMLCRLLEKSPLGKEIARFGIYLHDPQAEYLDAVLGDKLRIQLLSGIEWLIGEIWPHRQAWKESEPPE